MEQLGQKSNLKLFKVHVLNGFNRKTYNLGHPILFMNNLKIFQRLFAWLVCLDELEGFASRFILQNFVIWQYFWWVFLNKIRWTSFFVPTEFSSGVFKKLLDRNGFRTQARRTYWKVFQPSNPSERLEDQKSIIGKMNRTNKERKQSCFASNKIVFLLKTKKRIKSSHCSMKNRLEVCV